MWLICPECGATLPSRTARCPSCGRQPTGLPERRDRSRLVLGLALVALLVIGIAAALVVADAPALSRLASAVTGETG